MSNAMIVRRMAIGVALGSLGIRKAPAARVQPPVGEHEVRARAHALVTQMTEDEKAAQLMTLFALPPMQKLVDQRATGGGGLLMFVTDPKDQPIAAAGKVVGASDARAQRLSTRDVEAGRNAQPAVPHRSR